MSQKYREAEAAAQWQDDPALQHVLNVWGHGPEFIESLLSWGYVIAPDREADRGAQAIEETPIDDPEVLALWRDYLHVTKDGNPLGMTLAAYIAARQAQPQPITSGSTNGPVRDASGTLRRDPRYCFLTQGHSGPHEDYLTAWAGSHTPWCGYEMAEESR